MPWCASLIAAMAPPTTPMPTTIRTVLSLWWWIATVWVGAGAGVGDGRVWASRTHAIVISMRIFLSFILFVLSAFMASLRLVDARLVALAPPADDLGPAFLVQCADEPAGSMFLPSGDLTDLVESGSAPASDHLDDLC